MNKEVHDTLLRSQICEALEQFDEEDFSHTSVKVLNCDVFLTGSVNSQRARDRSLELVKKIRGVRRVRDELKVKK